MAILFRVHMQKAKLLYSNFIQKMYGTSASLSDVKDNSRLFKKVKRRTGMQCYTYSVMYCIQCQQSRFRTTLGSKKLCSNSKITQRLNNIFPNKHSTMMKLEFFGIKCQRGRLLRRRKTYRQDKRLFEKAFVVL